VPWAFADGRIHRYAFLKENFEDLHTKYRSEKLFRAIKDGKSAIFRCLPADVALSKSIGLAALSRPWKMIAAARNMEKDAYFMQTSTHRRRFTPESPPFER
jgi:hypothetical protein